MRRYLVLFVVLLVLAAGCDSPESESERAGPETTFADDTGTTTPPGDEAETTSAPSTSEATTTAAPSTSEAPPGAVPEVEGRLSEWTGARATLTVPLDHEHPAGPTIEIPVWRVEAGDPERRIGVLLAAPGGPGRPGEDLVLNASNFFTREVRERFDIVTINPRGTFPETQVVCPFLEFLSSVDFSPEGPDQVAAFEAAIESFVDDCTNTFGDLVPHVSTMDTVHDLAVLARALGEDQVSLYGVSYGTWTVATFAAVYPEMVRAAVLDAVYYTYMDPLQQEVAYWEAFDGLLVRAFEACDASAHCPIQGGAQAAFERVSAAAETHPFHENTGLLAVNQAAFHWLTEILLVEDADLLLEAVAAADQGDTEPLQWRWATAQSLFSWQDRLFAIACMDYPRRDETVLPDNTPELLAAAAPVAYDSLFPNTRLGMITAWICVHWPTEPDLVSAPLTGQGAGPILLVSSTGDLNTNLANAEQLAEQLVNDTLLIVEGNHHVSYGPYTGNPAQKCATDLIDTFFIELTPPPDRTQCTP